MRLFVAVSLPEEQTRYLDQLAQLFKQYADIRFTKPEQRHITLRFIEDGNPTKIDAALQTVHEKPFTLSLTKLGVFPNEARPRVLWVGTTNEIIPLRASIAHCLEHVVGKDERFNSHITLGRIMGYVNQGFRTQLTTEVKPYLFHVTAFHLIQSQETDAGHKHKTINTYPLA